LPALPLKRRSRGVKGGGEYHRCSGGRPLVGDENRGGRHGGKVQLLGKERRVGNGENGGGV